MCLRACVSGTSAATVQHERNECLVPHRTERLAVAHRCRRRLVVKFPRLCRRLPCQECRRSAGRRRLPTGPMWEIRWRLSCCDECLDCHCCLLVHVITQYSKTSVWIIAVSPVPTITYSGFVMPLPVICRVVQKVMPQTRGHNSVKS